VSSPESGALDAVARLTSQTGVTYGVDFENAKTVLSIGAPVLESWGTPARVWAVRGKLKIVQVSTRYSPGAAQADEWIALRPGAEAALVLALAHVVIRDRLYAKLVAPANFEAFQNLVAGFSPGQAEKITGIPAARIEQLAHQLSEGAPAVVVGGGDAAGGPLGDEEELAIAALNVLIGAVGRPGGLLARPSPVENGRSLAEAAPHSIGALVVDRGQGGPVIPWDLIDGKLAPGAVVVSLAAFHTGEARRADFVVPVPAYLECVEAAGTPCDATAATFSVCASLLEAPGFVVPPERFAAQLAEAFGVASPGTIEDVLKARAAAIHASRRGTVFSYKDGSSKPLSEVASADALLKLLTGGACWKDQDATPQFPIGATLPGADNSHLRDAFRGRFVASAAMPLAMLPFADPAATGEDALSPLLTKLYQESGLRLESNQVLVNPETGRARGLANGCLAELRTTCGACRVRVHFAPSVMPDVVEAAVGPSRAELAADGNGPLPRAIDVCSANGGWRVTPANLVRV
jgi:menaquinone reductase, molybdopterin-binding-like subunit